MQPSAIFQQTCDFYKHLYDNLRKIPKQDRFTWGEKCEKFALDALMLAAKADYLSRQEKLPIVRQLSFQIDMLKIFLRLGNELKIIDHKKYLARAGELLEIGKMLGGWIKSLN